MPEKEKILYIIEIDEKGRPVLKGVTGDFEKLDKTAHKTGSTLQTLKSHWAAMGAAISALGLYKVIGEMEELIALAETQRKSVAGMETVMRSMGRYTPEMSKELQDFAAGLQEVTNFGDEATLQGTKFLLTYKDITDDLLPRSIITMQDLAAMMGGDMKQAANMLGKASMGMTGELRKTGVTVDAATFKSQGYLGVLEEIEKQVSGQAAAMREPWAQSANVIDDAKESLGGFVGIAFEDYANDMIRLLPQISKSWQEVAEAINEARRVETEYHIEQLERQLAGKGVVMDLPGTMAPDFTIKGMSPAEEKAIQEKLKAYQEKLAALTTEANVPKGVGGDVALVDQANLENGLNELQAFWATVEEIDAAAAEIHQANVAARIESEMDAYIESEQRYMDAREGRLGAWEQDMAMAEEMANSHNILAASFDQLRQKELQYANIRNTVKSATMAAILGYEKLGVALKKALAQTLASIASEAAIRALFEAAYGFAALALGDSGAAAAHFQAAAIFAATAVAAGVAARALQASAGGTTAAESAGYLESRGEAVQSVAAEGEKQQQYAQKIDITLVNPIGEEEWFENNMIDLLKKSAKRDTEITVNYA
jgi:hypothetical protein